MTILRRSSKFVSNGRNRITNLSAAVVFWVTSYARSAWAVQAHGGAEGLVSHEIGHILFVAGMIYMLFQIDRVRSRTTAWVRFLWFLYVIILWNIVTLTGHFMHEYVRPEQIHKINGRIVAYTISGLSDAYFYLTRLDHLLLVPALLFLLMALKKWRTES